jgi:hypothetical protein
MEAVERAERGEPKDVGASTSFLRRKIVATGLTEEEANALLKLLRHNK